MQLKALKQAGCAEIFTDKKIGENTKRRALARCLKTLEDGDTLIVWKLDRLARSVRDLAVIIEDFRKRGIEFRSLTEEINTATPSGKLTFHIFAALAEFERDILRQRVNPGSRPLAGGDELAAGAKALNEGDLKKARALLRSGDYTKVQVAEELEVRRHTLWRALSYEAAK
jgi:DNA invertase Pin-like site-specific DNA recombinase